MLRIRRKQLDTLDALARRSFVRRATGAVASWEAPRLATLGREELVRWVEDHLARAVALGLEDEQVVVRWMEIAAAHGDAADDPSVAQRLLEPGALASWSQTRAHVDALLAGVETATGDRGESASGGFR